MAALKQFLGCAAMLTAGLIISTQTRAQFTAGSEGGIQAEEHSLLAGGAPPAAEGAKPAGPSYCQCVGEAESAAVEKIERALRGPLHSQGIEYTEVALQEVVNSLQDDYGIPIKLDHNAMEEIGLSKDEQVTINFHNISLRSALRLMLKEVQLTYIIQDEVLLVTTPQIAEENLKTCVYNVADLIGDRGSQFDSLVDCVVSCVATDTWAENGGGEAEIRPIKPGMLVISQTAAVHEEVRNLFEALRKTRANQVAAEQQTGAVGMVPADEIITRSYSLQLNPTNDTESMRSQIRELITQALPQETWSGQLPDGQGVALTVFNDRVVVRQSAEVQEKVQRLLSDSGIAKPATSGGGRSSGGFFTPGGLGGGAASAGPPAGAGMGASSDGGFPGSPAARSSSSPGFGARGFTPDPTPN